MKLVKACIAMAAFAALFVVPSIASAVQITHPTGTTAPVGTLITATNVQHSGTAKNTIMTVPGVGNFECTEATLTGELTKNAAGGASVEGNITTAEFRGHPGGGSNDCNSPLGTFVVKPSHTNNEVHTGKTSLPWCVRAAGGDTFTLRGGKCSEAARALTFSLQVTGIAPCLYEKAEVTGTYTTHPGDLIGTIINQEFKESALTSSIFCPNAGSLDMAFTLETDNELKQGLFIDSV